MNDYNFGNFLCMLREKNGMTQADVANKLGVTAAAVSKWENGSSKPRVEVLFELAQLLGVRSEELMCGQYIPNETLNPEVVKQINERYIYLAKVDSYNSASVKWRRLLAWIIDWNLIGLAVIILGTFISTYITYSGEVTAASATALLITILSYPVCFVLRDLIFGGRSIGKRIFGLVVLDKQTGKPAGAGKRVLRNLFLFIMHIDAIVMLVTGTTIGDLAAHTVVVRKKVLENNEFPVEISEINKYTAPKKISTVKTVLIIVGIIVLCIALLLGIIFAALNVSRNSQEYKLAYNYLIESDAFESLNVDESKIFHNRYSASSQSNFGSDEVLRTAQIGFVVKGHSFKVICHAYNDDWFVCEECTKFK